MKAQYLAYNGLSSSGQTSTAALIVLRTNENPAQIRAGLGIKHSTFKASEASLI